MRVPAAAPLSLPVCTDRREQDRFMKRVVLHLDREETVQGLRKELGAVSREQGLPLCFPLCQGLVLTELGIRHGLKAPNGRYYENRPLWAWPLQIEGGAQEAEEAVRQCLGTFGQTTNRWLYPAGTSLEQLPVDDLKNFCLWPWRPLGWLLDAVFHLGRRQTPPS